MNPRIPWIVTVKILTGTCTTVDTCGAYVGGFSPTTVESAPIYGITCKINRYRKVSSPYRLSRPQSMSVSLYCPWLHQLAVSTWLQVDQTCTVGSILDHVLIQRSFKMINQLDTSVMDATDKRFEGVVPSQGETKQWAILLSYICYALIFGIEGHLQWRYRVLWLMAGI